MYKWHGQLAVGLGRPVSKDIQRVTDGIAASLRAFSISAARGAEDRDDARAPISRFQRSQIAVSEASSLTPRPTTRGIDARSLAAKAPIQPSFKITRTPTDGPYPDTRRPGPQRRPAAGLGPPRRPGFDPSARGGRVGGGRGRGRGGKQRSKAQERRKQGPKPGKEEIDPYTEEEKAAFFHHECGYPHAYEPATSAESLARWGSSTIAGPRGIHENLMYKMQTATNVGSRYEHAGVHFHNMVFGNGLALFEGPKERERAEEWKDTPGMHSRKTGIGSLNEKDRAAVFGAWVAGHYQPLVSQKEGVLGQVEAFLRRNETYLPEDKRKLGAKLAELLPAASSNPTPQKKSA